jgi:hypothetical protein
MKASSQDSDCSQEKLLRLKAWTDPSTKRTPFDEAIDKMISEYPSMYGKCTISFLVLSKFTILLNLGDYGSARILL